MRLDRTFIHEIEKQANGNGTREAKFAFYKKAREAAKALSEADLMHGGYDAVIKDFGRVPVAICTAYTILQRQDRLSFEAVEWARLVYGCWYSRPADPGSVLIRDERLHPTKIDEYAGSFIRATLE